MEADARRRHEWLWGWDPTPGIVSVWADDRGTATIWRRVPETGELVRETDRFRPWLLYDRLDDLRHLGDSLARDGTTNAAAVSYRELEGPGALRFLLSAADWTTLTDAVLRGASDRLGKRIEHIRDLDWRSIVALPPDEQYLVATGRTYFKD